MSSKYCWNCFKHHQYVTVSQFGISCETEKALTEAFKFDEAKEWAEFKVKVVEVLRRCLKRFWKSPEMKGKILDTIQEYEQP